MDVVGPKNTPLAFKAFEMLRLVTDDLYVASPFLVLVRESATPSHQLTRVLDRYERTSLTQKLGWETRHRWHQTDWDAVKNDPDVIRMPQPAWLYGADAEKYAYDNAQAVIKAIEEGTRFVSTNVPEGHVHEDWTIESMMALESKTAESATYTIKAA